MHGPRKGVTGKTSEKEKEERYASEGN